VQHNLLKRSDLNADYYVDLLANTEGISDFMTVVLPITINLTIIMDETVLMFLANFYYQLPLAIPQMWRSIKTITHYLIIYRYKSKAYDKLKYENEQYQQLFNQIQIKNFHQKRLF